MAKRKPRRVKSKTFNYEVAGRRRHPGSHRWIHAMIGLALIAVATGIGYVWERNQLLAVGADLVKARRATAALEQERIQFEAKLSELKEPNRIRRELGARGIHLRPPSPDQIVYLTEPKPLTFAGEGEPRRPLGQKLWNSIVLGER